MEMSRKENVSAKSGESDSSQSHLSLEQNENLFFLLRISSQQKDMGFKNVDTRRFPNFGAIFMSNQSTMKECYERKLFGLPASQTGFVREVKVGMILFLFEHEKRKLYGVFEATSDGETNIVPHAFSSSGRQFPAQVRFTTIWHCCPLSEHEFRHAILENYYEKHKFNFGLSKHQVESLLMLFVSKKVEVPKSPTFINSARKRDRNHSSEETELKVINANHVSGIQPVTPREEPEKLNISSRSFSTDLGDFIPLDSPDDSELADAEAPFSLVGCFEYNQAGSATFECDEDLCFPKPYVIRPISIDETSKLENLCHPFAATSSDMDSCCGIAESSSAAGSLFNLGDCHLKDSTGYQEQSGLYYEDKIPSSKGLYSDTLDKRTSVFSRLDRALKDSVLEKVDDTRVDKSVDDIMEGLLQRQDKLRKMVKKVEPLEHENEYCHKKKRISVFSRLTRVSKN